MKTKLLLSLSVGAVLLASGCTNNNDYYNDAVPGTAVVTPAQAQVDAKILGGLIVLNQNEIAAATLAQTKASNQAVRNYATLMYRAHSANLQETQNVSKRIGVAPANGNVAMMLKQKGKQELATLNRLNGYNFDKAYIAAMVKDHTAALHLINHKLLTEATNPAVRRQLEISRAHVEQHLRLAQDIQRQLHA
ncbi:DUF4142 domain-containing protein [Legionella cardiaca]|uniref:DUF4142 domain-containing protein n=1 Tax=Legionella cardiaca TaxID=1071983 RepID=A0ABY8AWY7_9GAMM|nr:DUF4142 domain-containing protein [Legionella cardiaca]WED44005.1 DUF4142 domain-containing protein [Legionella cardiaca]